MLRKSFLFMFMVTSALWVAAQEAAKSAGYRISGTVTGFADGAVVDLLNGNNRMPEATTKIENGKFVISGKLDYPDFKLITFDKSDKFIPLFLDNSEVSVMVAKDQMDRAIVSGSKSHEDFMQYSRITQPYEPLFQQESVTDKEAAQQCVKVLKEFVNSNSGSYIAPLAVYRIYQLTKDDALLEGLFGKLAVPVQQTPLGGFVAQQVADAKRNPMGKVIADFEQPDVNGKMINIKSYRGKYVLVDFWASWCGPCRGENPNVVAAYKKYKDKNFTVLGVSLDKTKEAWVEAINHDGLTWNHISDLKGWSNGVAAQFGITSIPQNFLVDPKGVVIGRNLRGPALEEKLESVLK